MFSGEYRMYHNTPKRDPVIIPLFSKKASWPLQDVLQLQNNVHLNNPPLSLTHSLLLSLRLSSQPSLAAADQDGKYTQLVHKVTKLEGRHALARASLPWLPQTRSPRRWMSLKIIFGQVSGCRTLLWAAVKKRRRGRHTRSAPFIRCLGLRWRLICLSSFLPFLPIRALPLLLVHRVALRWGPPHLHTQALFSPTSLLEAAGGEAELWALQTCVLTDFVGFLKTVGEIFKEVTSSLNL